MTNGTNPNDEVRRQILAYFYDRNVQATSRFGKKGSAVRISDVKRELKQRHALTQQQVMSNLTYLLDREWVKQIDQHKEVTTRGGTTVPSVVAFYEVSANGIEKIEGESEFQPPDRYPGINIQATGSNVITLGDGNLVNVEYRQLFQQLAELFKFANRRLGWYGTNPVGQPEDGKRPTPSAAPKRRIYTREELE